MRIFNIQEDGCFEEFSQAHFPASHEEAVLERWLENNPDGILEDSKLLIIGRQVSTNLGSIIDLLGIDQEGDLVVVELKRGRTPRDTLAQALEYASFVEELDTDQLESIFRRYLNDESLSIAEYHRTYFELAPDEAAAFNKEQRVVIVGQNISSEIRQTALFLKRKGLPVTCLEFSYFQAEGGKHLLSYDIVVGKEPKKVKQVASGALPVVSQASFLDSLDENGRAVFERLLEFASRNALPVNWGTKGFSMNVDKNGKLVPICFGYPPNSVYKQSVYTALRGQGGMLFKLDIPEAEIESLLTAAKETEIFQPAGRRRDLKILIDRKFTDKELDSLITWLKMVVEIIGEHELK